jgi:zinc protease
MATPLTQRVSYQRLENGLDLYLLKASTRDVVTCQIALPGGTHATYARQSIAALLTELLPGGTTTRTKSSVLKAIEALGAQVSVSSATNHLLITIGSRKAVFPEVLAIVIETLTKPSWHTKDYSEAHLRVSQALRHTKENTELQANIAAHRALYKSGHPHWRPTTRALGEEVADVTKTDVLQHFKQTLTALGAIVCVVGDIAPRSLASRIVPVLSMLPERTIDARSALSVTRTRKASDSDIVHTIEDKFNIDTILLAPLSLTKDSSDFHAFAMGTAILGGSSSARLFNILRTKQSLTYGARAQMEGLQAGYPGYLRAWAIFPSDVFARGRSMLRDVVLDWSMKGVTQKELTREKETIVGKFQVGLTTTGGVCGALMGALLAGRPVSYVDEYPERMAALTRTEVNHAIRDTMRYDLAVCTAAGAIAQDGTPLPRD